MSRQKRWEEEKKEEEGREEVERDLTQNEHDGAFIPLSPQRPGTSSHHSSGTQSFCFHTLPPQGILASLVTLDEHSSKDNSKRGCTLTDFLLFLPRQFSRDSADSGVLS